MANKVMQVGIKAIAYSLGSKIVTNEQLASENPDWPMMKILERTGVSSRPYAHESETALDLAEVAARKLFAENHILINEIDALIFCTQTPDHILPPNSSLLHGRLGLSNGVMAFDISHACSGFIYGLGIGRSLIQSGVAKNVLLITADTYSRLLHPEDRSTRPIFGDGAAATLIAKDESSLTILDMTFFTAGSKADRFIVKAGGALYPLRKSVNMKKDNVIDAEEQYVCMDGMGILFFFTNVVPKAVQDLLDRNMLVINDIELFIFHQASQLALEGIQRSLKIPKEKMVYDLFETGNLVSASIPVAFARSIGNTKLNSGKLIVLCGFGVGLSWGTALVRA